MGVRKPLPKRLEKQVFQRFGSTCPFCNESDISVLQIHHIEPFAKVQKHELENLILVCANCHGRITAGEISTEAVHRKKEETTAGNHSQTTMHPKTNLVNVINSNNNGIVANTLIIKSASLARYSPTLNGTIGSDRDMRNYAKYLIDRYHKFKRDDVGKQDMNYQQFYMAIKRNFGAKWDHIPSGRFQELVFFIQERINKTILGKKNKAGGVKNYKTLDEYLAEHGS